MAPLDSHRRAPRVDQPHVAGARGIPVDAGHSGRNEAPPPRLSIQLSASTPWVALIDCTAAAIRHAAARAGGHTHRDGVRLTAKSLASEGGTGGTPP